MAGKQRSAGGGMSSVTLGIVVLCGALAVGLVWSGMNALLAGSGTSDTSMLALGFGALLLAAIGIWLWRYLNGLLHASQHPRKEG